MAGDPERSACQRPAAVSLTRTSRSPNLEREVLTVTSAVASRLDSIKNKGGVRSREIAQLLETTPQTISRWQTGRAEPQPDGLQRLLALEWLVEQLADLYSPDEARLWLFSRHTLLGGRRPADLIAEGRTEEVLALIDQLRDGAYL